MTGAGLPAISDFEARVAYQGYVVFYTLASPELILMVKKPGNQKHARHAKNQDQ